MQGFKNASRRRMYRGGRQGRVAGISNRAWVVLGAVGLAPRRLVILEVRGRRSGRVIALPVVVTDYDNERYLVAMLGPHTSWVRNVRAAEGDAVLRHRHRERVRLVEIDVADRAPILRRYLDLAPGARAHLPIDQHAELEDFAKIAAEYPVFRIDERPPASE
jgi:deazaflavin-dependent oxidoreductase (nitroreductase family)